MKKLVTRHVTRRAQPARFMAEGSYPEHGTLTH